MKTCPRCKKKTMHNKRVWNSLSRRDNNTYICNDCGNEEAFIDEGWVKLSHGHTQDLQFRG